MINKNCIHNVWRHHDAKSIAFIDNREYSYEEYSQQVDLYSTWLAHKGVKAGDKVGVFMPNCIDFLFVYFGAVRLGAVIVPVNSFLIDSEVDYIANDSEMVLLVSSKPVKVSCPCYLGKDVRKEVAAIDPESIVPEYSGAHMDDVTTIIYTSGTTGNPKGAMLTHTNLYENAKAMTETLDYYPEDRVLAILPMYHCFGFLCAIMISLLVGSRCYIQKNFNATDIRKLVRDEKLTVAYMVPPMIQLLSRLDAGDDLKSLRLMVSGGASLPKAVAELFESVYGIPIIEGYGLSEASPVCCFNRIDNHKYYSCGPAIHGVTTKVVDTHGQECKRGEIGELLIQGPNVMKGYYKLPEATASTLVDGWLHTGDMAYMDEEDFVYIVDRSKDMVNLNGENVYPREIENHLYQHPDVLEAAVIGREDNLRGETVWAYVVMKDGKKMNASELRKYLKERVAPFKVPRGFVQRESLPKNATGKILKRLLN